MLYSLSPRKVPFTLSVFTDNNQRVTVNFVCSGSKSVGFRLFSDDRTPLIPSYSRQMSLVFLALRLELNSR